jgi:hypothetical protein
MRGFLNFIASNPWLIIIILGGLFNLGVRMQQKAKEQRAKRAALAEIQRRKAEALRTGKPMTEPVIVYDEPQKKPKAPSADERQARIEALRKQRMEQLRAMREKRSGVAGTPQNPAQTKPPAPVQRRTPAPVQAQTRVERQQPRFQTPPRVPQVRPAQAPRPVPVPTATPPAPAAPVSAYDTTPSPIRSRSIVGDNAISARAMLRDPRLARQAIVAREILDAPIALRDPDTAPGNVDR